MNQKSLAMIFLIAIIGTVVVFQSVQAYNEGQVLGTKTKVIQFENNRNKQQIIEATYRLGYHCKMLVVESLIITKKSINLALDTAIDAL